MEQTASHPSVPSRSNMLLAYFYRRNVTKLDRLLRIIRNRSELEYRRAQFRPYSIEAESVTSLNQNGFAPYSPNPSLAGDLIESCHRRFENTNVEDMVAMERKNFYRDSIQDQDYEPNTPFMHYALDNRILEVVGSYLGTAPYLQSIELIYSVPRKTGEELHQTHLYHRDKIDRRVVKLFTYITDVDDQCGPLVLMPVPESNKVPWYVEIPHYIDDATLSKYADLSIAEKFVGPAGSAMMADTKNMLHYGSRCEKPRLTFVVHYNTGFALFPRNRIHDRWKDGHYGLNSLQKLALGQY